MYKQRHPRKFIPQNINFPVFLRGESSSRESFFPLKYKSSERDVSNRPIMLEYEVNKHSRGIDQSCWNMRWTNIQGVLE